VLALTTACATQPPTETMAVGRASVERASGPAAAEAPMALQRARDKIAAANAAYAAENYDEARRLAQEADADAQLAEATARANRSGESLALVRDSIRALKEQVDARQR
jgi:hypothetical protein